MRAKPSLFLLFLLIFPCLVTIASAETNTVYWTEQFSYSSVSQMQSAGWTLFRNPAGVGIHDGAVILNGKDNDTVILYHDRFPSGIYDWKAETRAAWLGQGHSVLSVFVVTERHHYGFACDGYYKEFSFYRDQKKILHFGIYEEGAGEWVTLTMKKEGNTISMFFNGELKNTYIEEDTQPSQVIGADMISPWRGDAKYDYYILSPPNATGPVPPTDTGPVIPTSTLIIGGIIGAVAVGGVIVYHFVFSGGHAGPGGGGGSGEGDDTILQERPPSPQGSGTPPAPVGGATPGGGSTISPLAGESLQPDRPTGIQEPRPPASIDDLRMSGSLPDLKTGALEPGGATHLSADGTPPDKVQSTIGDLRYPTAFPSLGGGSAGGSQTPSSVSLDEKGLLIKPSQQGAIGETPQRPSTIFDTKTQTVLGTQSTAGLDSLRMPDSVPDLETGKLEQMPSRPQTAPSNPPETPPPEEGLSEALQSAINEPRPPTTLPELKKPPPPE